MSANSETIKLFASIVTALCMIVLVPLQGWQLAKLVDVSERLMKVETWQGMGPRYTGNDAAKDLGVLANVLESQGKTLDDHELRIRTVERFAPPQAYKP